MIDLSRLPKPLSQSGLIERIDSLIEGNGGELPSIPKYPYVKCNHGPSYNEYGPGGIGEGIWVRPVAGNGDEGIGMLSNDSLNEGDWGDLVQYASHDPNCNPIIIKLAPAPKRLRPVIQRQLERAEAEVKVGVRNASRRRRYAERKAAPAN